VAKWKKEIDAKVLLPNGQALPVVLLANKSDVEGAVVDSAALDAYCEENGFVAWFETSAKTNHKIDAAARFLVENILGHEDVFAEKKKKREELALGGNLKPGVVSPGPASTPGAAPSADAGGCC